MAVHAELRSWNSPKHSRSLTDLNTTQLPRIILAQRCGTEPPLDPPLVQVRFGLSFAGRMKHHGKFGLANVRRHLRELVQINLAGVHKGAVSE
jgi:hypothetical protein